MKRFLASMLVFSSVAFAAGLDVTASQAAVGIYDSKLTSRVKAPDKRKVVIWAKGLPELKSQYAEVTYDPEARSQTYFLLLKGYSGTLKDLAPKTVRKGMHQNTPVLQISGGMLDGSLLMLQKNTVKVYSSIYVLRFEPDLMKYLK
ncbi:hypothetical protein [Deinococcus cellulosilyticus]|nr:hypothetical protein [Deinococcus cellulosilyticus]